MFFKQPINDAFSQPNPSTAHPAPLSDQQAALLHEFFTHTKSQDPLVKNLLELIKSTRQSDFTILLQSRSAYGAELDGKSYTLLTATIRNPAAGSDAVTFGVLLSVKREVII